MRVLVAIVVDSCGLVLLKLSHEATRRQSVILCLSDKLRYSVTQSQVRCTVRAVEVGVSGSIFGPTFGRVWSCGVWLVPK